MANQLARKALRACRMGAHVQGVISGVRRLFNNAGDFSSYLLQAQAQASGADVIALGSTGADLVNLLKQAQEFGIGADGRQRLASFVLTVPDIAALGLDAAKGVLVNEAFYWDLNDATRAWSRRFAARNGGRMPSVIQAGDYSVAGAYLRAVAAARTTDAAAVMRVLHETPVRDPLVPNATLRPDGHLDLVATIPAAEAFHPLAQSLCAAVRKG